MIISDKWELFDVGHYIIHPSIHHVIGSEDCPRCDTKPCECGGMIHTETCINDYGDVDYWTMCDKCGNEILPL